MSAWKFKESLLFGFSLFIIGCIIEFFDDISLKAPPWPENVIIGLIFISLLVIIYFFFQKTTFTRWITSPAAGISAIFFFIGLSLILGLIPQKQSSNYIVTEFAFNDITSSFQFIILLIFFLVVLGLTTIKRISTINKKNIGFILNHLGLWLIVASMTLGSGDLERYTLVANEKGTAENVAYSNKGKTMVLDFAIKLNSLKIIHYEPSELLTRPQPQRFISDISVYLNDDNNPMNALVEVNQPLKFNGWNIYLAGYENSTNESPRYGSFLLIKDPWLPVVYLGIFLMICGILMLIWKGSNK